MKFTNKPLQT